MLSTCYLRDKNMYKQTSINNFKQTKSQATGPFYTHLQICILSIYKQLSLSYIGAEFFSTWNKSNSRIEKIHLWDSIIKNPLDSKNTRINFFDHYENHVYKYYIRQLNVNFWTFRFEFWMSNREYNIVLEFRIYMQILN